MTRKKSLPNYRIRVSEDNGRGLTYITRYDGRVSYISASETPLALSNLVQSRAAELRFALEDVTLPNVAAAIVRQTLGEMWKNNPAQCPKVEVL
jgi:hypothetical protein